MKKQKNIFEHMRNILNGRYDDTELKEYNQYLLNRFLSMEDSFYPFVEFANFTFVYQLDRQQQYKLSYLLFKDNKKYVNILKKEKISKPDFVKKFEQRVKRYLKMSDRDFRDFYLNFLKEIEYYIMKFGFEDKKRLTRYYLNEGEKLKKRGRYHDLF